MAFVAAELVPHIHFLDNFIYLPDIVTGSVLVVVRKM